MAFIDAYIKGNIHLIKFYIKHLSTLQSLPKWMKNPQEMLTILESKDSNSEPFSLSLPAAYANKYNTEYDALKVKLRDLHNGSGDEGRRETISYSAQLAILFILRLCCIVSAWYNRLDLTIFLASLQIIIAPYSLFVALTLVITLAPPYYASHYLAYTGIPFIGRIFTYAIGNFIPNGVPMVSLFQSWTDVFTFKLTPWIVIAFFVADQAACLWCHLCTPSIKFSHQETLIHAVWGFLNTKTYHLVLLLHLMQSNVGIPLIVWFIDAIFQITGRLVNLFGVYIANHTMLFYHQHRMAHLPRVYEHSHKLHHYLHGTNAFDAHIYGNGMPEELGILVIELLAGSWFGIIPTCFNRLVAEHTYQNKVGHTQKPDDTKGENFHANHHLRHVKNFGIYNCLLDMYFNTSVENDRYVIRSSLAYGSQSVIFEVIKTEECLNNGTRDIVTFKFTPRILNH